MNAAGQAAEEFGAQIIIIKKTSPQYAEEKDPPPCPSVMVNGRFIAKNEVATYDQIKAVILSEHT